MFIVNSFSSDIFSQTPHSQTEISNTLTPLFKKYGKPTIRHMVEDFEEEADTFDLNYYQFDEADVFNLSDKHYLSLLDINIILQTEAEELKLEEEDEDENEDENEDEDEADQQSNTTKEDDPFNSVIQKLIEHINVKRKQIYDILSQKQDTLQFEEIKENLDSETYKNKRKLYRKFRKIKRGIDIKYKKLLEAGDYYYLLIYFDKGTVYDEDKLYYDKKPERTWASINYELYNHPNAHLKIMSHLNKLCEYTKNVLVADKSKYDILNIFYSKINLEKEFNFEMTPMNELWINNNNVTATPTRLTNTKFYNIMMTVVDTFTNSIGTISQIYKSTHESSYCHYIIVCVKIPTGMDTNQKYYNTDNTENCKLEAIAKNGSKYVLYHYRTKDDMEADLPNYITNK